MIKYLDMNLHSLELKDIMLSITSKIIQVLLVLAAGCFPMGSIRARRRQPGGTRTAPTPGIRRLHGDGNGSRLSWDVGPA